MAWSWEKGRGDVALDSFLFVVVVVVISLFAMGMSGLNVLLRRAHARVVIFCVGLSKRA